MVDKALILRKLSELDEYSKQIGEFAATTTEEYCGNWKIQRFFKYGLNQRNHILDRA